MASFATEDVILSSSAWGKGALESVSRGDSDSQHSAFSGERCPRHSGPSDGEPWECIRKLYSSRFAALAAAFTISLSVGWA